jgi:coenzyme F420 hydrogenase subunit beta
MNNTTSSHPADTPPVDHAGKKKLCSSCGLCMVREWPAEESIQSCVFKVGWLGKQEIDLFGRERSVESIEETHFGISSDTKVIGGN